MTRDNFDELIGALKLRNSLLNEEFANSPVGQKLTAEAGQKEHDACVAFMIAEAEKNKTKN